MKTEFFTTTLTAAVVAAFCLVNQMASAEKLSLLDAAKKELCAVKAAELPAKAAKIVSQAKIEQRETTTETVITAVDSVRPAAVISTVGTISRENPALASVAVGKASQLRPKLAATIARAAAVGAKSQVLKIAYAACKASPGQYAKVAAAITQVVPDIKHDQLWTAIVAAVPSAKATVSPTIVGPPVVGPPFTGVTPPPGEIDRDDTGETHRSHIYSGP